MLDINRDSLALIMKIDREARIFLGVMIGTVTVYIVIDLALWLLRLRAPDRIPISGLMIWNTG